MRESNPGIIGSEHLCAAMYDSQPGLPGTRPIVLTLDLT